MVIVFPLYSRLVLARAETKTKVHNDQPRGGDIWLMTPFTLVGSLELVK